MARTFKGYASAYSAAQFQPRRVRRFQKRNLVVDFNGAMPSGALITQVIWECISPWVTKMSNAAVSADRKSVSVDVEFNFSGFSNIKATATSDDGSQQNYEFAFDVLDAPLYPSATYLSNDGPFSLTAVAL